MPPSSKDSPLSSLNITKPTFSIGLYTLVGIPKKSFSTIKLSALTLTDADVSNPLDC